MTWSPVEGTSPDPIRRSSALTPPESGSSMNAGFADFAGEAERRKEKKNVEVGRMAESERSLLVSTIAGGGVGVGLLGGRESL